MRPPETNSAESRNRIHLMEGEQAGARYRLGFDLSRTVGRTGSHLANRAGTSREFHDHREYLPGDDLRHIDWGAFARSDKLIVKLYQEEVSPHLDLVLDCSRSMALEGTAKLRAALALTALLARAGANAGFTFQAWACGDAWRRLGGLGEPPSAWVGPTFDDAGNPGEVLLRNPPPWRPRGVRLLVSDLLWMGDPSAVLQVLSRNASQTAVVQLLAREDAAPEALGNVRLVDSESGEASEAFVDAAALARYRSALSRHQDSWQSACRSQGAVMTTLIAEDLVEGWSPRELVEAGILAA